MTEERDLVETVAELEEWLETVGRTAQITYRIRVYPPYLVRFVKDPIRHGERIEYQYVQATGRTLSEAFEGCVEAYFASGIVEPDRDGRRRPRPRRSAAAASSPEPT